MTVLCNRLEILTEFGFDRLLAAFTVFLPFYYLLKPNYRLLSLLVFFISFLIYALGIVSGVFYLLASIFILFTLRSRKSFFIYILFFAFVGVLVLLRIEYFYFPRLIIAVPYLAAAFMLRCIRFYYESKHKVLQSGFWMELAYFFIPANLCFMLFPVLDPLQFPRSYSGITELNNGVKRIFTGLGLILLYRIVQFLFPISFEEVNNFSSLIHYGTVKYAFTINISGMLICAIGTINLCGFSLPPLFGNFFFSATFSEMWRKINSYWREFMIRVFYYPIFLKLRKMKPFFRVAVSINIAFFISWILHEYQLFWISGYFDLKPTSLLYWMLFGNLVAFNIYQEFFFNKQPVTAPFKRGVYAAGVFLIAALLWLLWQSETAGEFGFLIYAAFNSPHFTIIDLLLTLAVVTGIYLACSYVTHWLKNSFERISHLFLSYIFPVFGLFLILSSFSFFEKTFPELKNQLSVFSAPEPNEEENFLRDEGYYENVVGGDKNKGRPWEIKLKGQQSWGSTKGATRRTGDILLREFIPNSLTDMGYFTLKINSDGLRDVEYPLVKDASTVRLALLGGSNECGYGVEKEQIFETLTEKYLDSLYASQNKNIEIINFAGLGNMLLQDMEIVKRKVLKYKPDILLYFSHPQEYKHIARNFSKLILNSVDLKYEFLASIKEKAKVSQSMSRQEIISRLLPYSDTIIKWAYADIVAQCNANGMKPVWVFLPTTKDDDPAANFDRLSELAENSGFIIIDLSTCYKGYTFKQIRVKENDFHPSVLGHQLISRQFTQQLLEKKKEIGLE